MKKINIQLIVIGCIILLGIGGCQKEPERNTGIVNPSNPGNTKNRAPIAMAGNDTSIILPANLARLNGSGSYDPDNDSITYKWTKTNGPATFSIINPDSSTTNVANLIQGTYEFALTIKDSKGAEAVDLVVIQVNASIPPPPPPANRPPLASSGYDLIVHWPADSGFLYGNVYDPDMNIATIQWTKIAGPASFHIVRPDSVFSRITNLQKGVYKFEIKVTDSAGLSASDTNTVVVGEMPANPQEIILADQSWGCHWDCFITITQLYNIIPPDRVFKVFIKRDNSTIWHEVLSAEQMTTSVYGYALRKGTLWIYNPGFDIGDSPDIKIVF
ncbi:MAG TPA: hypothetical protein VF476_13310 [Chitinophagaceae bacterium]